MLLGEVTYTQEDEDEDEAFQYVQERWEELIGEEVSDRIWRTPEVARAFRQAVEYLKGDKERRHVDDSDFITFSRKVTKAMAMAMGQWTSPSQPLLEDEGKEAVPRLSPSFRTLTGSRANVDSCAQAVSEYLKREMERSGYARQFRDTYLGGRLLDEKEAWKCLVSPLWQVLSLEDFQDLGLNPITAVGELAEPLESVNPSESPLFAKVSQAVGNTALPDRIIFIGVEIAGGNGSVIPKTYERDAGSYACIAPPTGAWGAFAQPLFLVNPQCEGPLNIPSEAKMMLRQEEGGRDAAAPHYVEGFVRGSARTGSVCGDAITACAALQANFCIDAWDALRFLLTGIAPSVLPGRMQIYDYEVSCPVMTRMPDIEGKAPLFSADGPVALLLQPWVSPEMVYHFWRWHLGVGSRGMSPLRKNLELFRFVLAETSSDRTFGWTRLSKRWNREQNTQMTPSDFRKAFTRVEADLFPNRKSTTKP